MNEDIFKRFDKYWADASIKDIEKELARIEKAIQRSQKSGLNEMSWNGHRSTRKAVSNFAAARLGAEKWDMESYLEQRKKANSVVK